MYLSCYCERVAVNKEIKQQKTSLDIKRLNIKVIFLVLILLSGTSIYGLNILILAISSIIFAILIEFLFTKIRKRKYVLKSESLITPLVFVLLMPPGITLEVILIGTFFGVFFGKMIFGGYGKYIFIPSSAAYIFTKVTFPNVYNNSFINASDGSILESFKLVNPSIEFSFTEIMNHLLGVYSGPTGSTLLILVLVLGFTMILLKSINYLVPFSIIFFTTLFTFVFGLFYPDQLSDPFLGLLQGQLLFVAFFVATDESTTPMGNISKVFYGLGIALITVLIRGFATASEGIIYSLIIMNAISPMLEKNKLEVKK